ncbi:hypothetical protein HDV05_002358 [Chytridiales sp. JEL 0842]|nr:hypothetical protein HDV05_002358 [Chytridiales sp. JEL 0842]
MLLSSRVKKGDGEGRDQDADTESAAKSNATLAPTSVTQGSLEELPLSLDSAPLRIKTVHGALVKGLSDGNVQVSLKSYNILASAKYHKTIPVEDFYNLIRLVSQELLLPAQTAKVKPTKQTVDIMRSLYHDMLDVFEHLLSKNVENLEPIPEDIHVLFLNFFDQIEDVDMFERVWKYLFADSSMTISLETYNLILSHLAKEKKAEEAYTVFQQLVKDSTPAKVESENEGEEPEVPATRPPDDRSYLHLLNAYINAKDLDGAMSIFQSLPSALEIQEAIATGQLQQSTTLPPHRTLAMFNIFIHAYGRIPDFETVHLLMEQLHVEGHRPNTFTYNMLIDCHSKANDPVGALEVVKQMKADQDSRPANHEFGPNLVTFNTLISMFAKKALPKEAEEVVEAMKTLNLAPDSFTVTSLMDAYKRNGNMEGAMRAFKRFTETADENGTRVPVTASMYNVLLSGYGLRTEILVPPTPGSVSESESEQPTKQKITQSLAISKCNDLYTDMISKNVLPTRVTFRTLLNVCKRFGDLQTAEKWLNDLKASKISLDFHMVESYLRTLIAHTVRQSAYITTSAEKPQPLLPKLKPFLASASKLRVKSSGISNALLWIHLNDQPLKVADVLGKNYEILFTKMRVKPTEETLKVALDASLEREKKLGGAVEVDGKREGQALARVFEDLVEGGVVVSEEVKDVLGKRLKELLGGAEEVENEV